MQGIKMKCPGALNGTLLAENQNDEVVLAVKWKGISICQ